MFDISTDDSFFIRRRLRELGYPDGLAFGAEPYSCQEPDGPPLVTLQGNLQRERLLALVQLPVTVGGPPTAYRVLAAKRRWREMALACDAYELFHERDVRVHIEADMSAPPRSPEEIAFRETDLALIADLAKSVEMGIRSDLASEERLSLTTLQRLAQVWQQSLEALAEQMRHDARMLTEELWSRLDVAA
jgi:hypothetical protein